MTRILLAIILAILLAVTACGPTGLTSEELDAGRRQCAALDTCNRKG